MFYQEYETIPSNLDDLQPGPELGGVLACIDDIDDLSPHDKITVMRAHQRQRSFHDAELYRTMASVTQDLKEDHPQYGLEAASAEIQCALHLTRRATEKELAFALDLQRRLPQVSDALFRGDIDVRRAKTFSHCTIHLPDAVARHVVERVIEAAPNLTTGQLKARLEREVIEADPGGAQERYESAVTTRRLITESTTDGTANLLGLDLAPHRVSAITRKVNGIARSLRTKDETRTMDQLRADVFVDLLIGSGEASNDTAAVVHIRADLDTLVGLAAHPGELNGYGNVIADIAKQVAAEQETAQWQWAITHPETGEVLHNGITSRRPSAALRRTVEARNHTCVFPGCRMPATDCDLDHTTRYAEGGKTHEENLAPLCRYHHRIKHHSAWSYVRRHNNSYRWTSQLGHTYTTSGTPP